jgi:DNA-binding response OmpR family regulator
MNHVVLCIEDDHGNRHLMERLLLRRPHTVVHLAGNAQEGISTAVRERPGLILLDNQLPDATGRDVLWQLASSAVTAGIPVIVVSGDVGGSVQADLRACGAADFLTKPFDIGEFLAMVDRFLG